MPTSRLLGEPNPADSTVQATSRTLTPATFLNANAARKGCTIQNNSNGYLFVKYGEGATTSLYSVKVGPNGTLEVPFPAFTGIISGTWAVAGSGNALVTEVF